MPRGLAVSGHNRLWVWGVPPGLGNPLLVVSYDREDCGGLFRERVLGERLPPTPYAMPYENGHAIWICRGCGRRFRLCQRRSVTSNGGPFAFVDPAAPAALYAFNFR